MNLSVRPSLFSSSPYHFSNFFSTSSTGIPVFSGTVFFHQRRARSIMALRRSRTMTRPMRKRKCKHCRTCFVPDPRNVEQQHYCAQPSCRQASKAARQRQWLHKPDDRDYFRGPAHVERVQQWRKVCPGYWRRESRRPADALQTLQEPILPTRGRRGDGPPPATIRVRYSPWLTL